MVTNKKSWNSFIFPGGHTTQTYSTSNRTDTTQSRLPWHLDPPPARPGSSRCTGTGPGSGCSAPSGRRRPGAPSPAGAGPSRVLWRRRRRILTRQARSSCTAPAPVDDGGRGRENLGQILWSTIVVKCSGQISDSLNISERARWVA